MNVTTLKTKRLEPFGNEPNHRFHFNALAKEEEDPELSAALAGVMAVTRDLLKEMGLPEDIEGDLLVQHFLRQDFPDPRSTEGTARTVLDTHRNILPLLPFRPKIPFVLQQIDQIVEQIMKQLRETHPDLEELELVQRNIRRALISMLDQNLAHFHHTPLNRVDLLDPENPNKRGKRFSMEDLRQAVLSLQRRITEVEEKNHMIEFLHSLGILDEVEHDNALEIKEDRRALNRVLEENLTKAWTLYKRVIDTVNKLIKKRLIQGKEVQDGIGLLESSNLLRQLNVFDLLELLFTEKISGYTEFRETSFSELDFYEAQVIAVLFTIFCETSEDPTFKHSGELIRPLTRRFIAGLFENGLYRRKETLYRYRDEGFQVRARITSPELKKIKPIAGFEDIGEEQKLVSFVSLRQKGRTSTVIRRLWKSPGMEVCETPDMIAGRLILWGITKADLIEEGKQTIQDYVRSIALQIGTSLGLKHSPDKDNRNELLEVGEFCIEYKLDEPYPSIRVYGRISANPEDTVGVRCEIQMIPKDVHEMTEADYSPLSHENYGRKRLLELALILLPRPLFPKIHKIICDELTITKRRRNSANEALQRASNLA